MLYTSFDFDKGYCLLTSITFSKGLYDSIGVLIWTAGSYEDRLVPPGVPTFSMPLNITSAKDIAGVE